MITYNNCMLFGADSRDVIASIRTEEYENAAEQLIMNPTPDNVKAYKEAVKSLNGGKSVSCTFSNCKIDGNLFDKLCGAIPPKPEKWTMITEEFVQRRKHRKKRINKKWAKRYGFKKRFCYYKVADINSLLVDKKTAIHEFKLDNVEKCYLVDENQFDLYNSRDIYNIEYKGINNDCFKTWGI